MKRYTITNPTDLRFGQTGELTEELDNSLLLSFTDGKRAAYPKEFVAPAVAVKDDFHMAAIATEPPIGPDDLLRAASQYPHLRATIRNLSYDIGQAKLNITLLRLLADDIEGPTVASGNLISHSMYRMLHGVLGLLRETGAFTFNACIQDAHTNPVRYAEMFTSLAKLRWYLNLIYDVLGTTDVEICELAIEQRIPPAPKDDLPAHLRAFLDNDNDDPLVVL